MLQYSDSQLAGRGSVESRGIGFEDLRISQIISCRKLMLHCWDELAGVPPFGSRRTLRIRRHDRASSLR